MKISLLEKWLKEYKNDPSTQKNKQSTRTIY